MGRNKEQASREFGVKFADALRQKAREAAREHDLDDRYIVLGAAEHLRKDAEFRINGPLGEGSDYDPRRRTN